MPNGRRRSWSENSTHVMWFFIFELQSPAWLAFQLKSICKARRAQSIYISFRNLCRETRERWIEKNLHLLGFAGAQKYCSLVAIKKRRKLRGLILIICWVIAAANTSTTQVWRRCCCFWLMKHKGKREEMITCYMLMRNFNRCFTELGNKVLEVSWMFSWT